MADVIRINDNTWRIEDGFVRFFLLEGSEKALLIDSGMTTVNAKAIAGELTDLQAEMLNTHGDPDHTAGNGEFQKYYMHPADYIRCGVEKRIPQCELIPIADGDVLDLGNRELEIIAVPGHTYGSVAVYDRSKGLLFAGDSVQTDFIFMFGAHRNPEVYKYSLEKLAEMKERFSLILPSHGEPELEPEYIEKVLEAWNCVCNGEIEGHPADVHGNKVTAYDAGVCGFFCEPGEK